MSLEDAGFMEKGEVGPYFESVDTTYKGTFPINTDGGQLSAGQPVGGAGGFPPRYSNGLGARNRYTLKPETICPGHLNLIAIRIFDN